MTRPWRENLKKQGFTLSLSSAAAVERKIYRIAFINETTGATILELTGQDLLDAAWATQRACGHPFDAQRLSALFACYCASFL